jgi:hypothetical protein
MASLFGNLFFGLVGYAAWRYGKSRQAPLKMLVAVLLCLFPWVVPDGALWLWGVGALLTGALFVV